MSACEILKTMLGIWELYFQYFFIAVFKHIFEVFFTSTWVIRRIILKINVIVFGVYNIYFFTKHFYIILAFFIFILLIVNSCCYILSKNLINIYVWTNGIIVHFDDDVDELEDDDDTGVNTS